MRQGLPFTAKNRSRLTGDCIESMNEPFMDCTSKTAPEYRETLRQWAPISSRSARATTRPTSWMWGHRWMSSGATKGTDVAMLKLALILALLLGTGGPPAAYADSTTNYSYPHLYDAGVPFYQHRYVYREPRALGRADLVVRRWRQ
jgi:hypothetical protein